MEEIANIWEDAIFSWIGRISVVKMFEISKDIRVRLPNASHISISMAFFIEIEKTKPYGTTKTSSTKAVLSKNKAGGVTILDFKIYYKIMVIRTVGGLPLMLQVKKPPANARDVGSVLSPGGPTC